MNVILLCNCDQLFAECNPQQENKRGALGTQHDIHMMGSAYLRRAMIRQS